MTTDLIHFGPSRAVLKPDEGTYEELWQKLLDLREKFVDRVGFRYDQPVIVIHGEVPEYPDIRIQCEYGFISRQNSPHFFGPDFYEQSLEGEFAMSRFDNDDPADFCKAFSVLSRRFLGDSLATLRTSRSAYSIHIIQPPFRLGDPPRRGLRNELLVPVHVYRVRNLRPTTEPFVNYRTIHRRPVGEDRSRGY